MSVYSLFVLYSDRLLIGVVCVVSCLSVCVEVPYKYEVCVTGSISFIIVSLLKKFGPLQYLIYKSLCMSCVCLYVCVCVCVCMCVCTSVCVL